MRMSDMRDYRREDFDPLVALYQRGKGDEFRFEPGWPERFPVIPLPMDEVRLKAFSDARVLVVPGEKGLAGVIYWQQSHIVGLLVDPQSRGRGLGRALMQAVLDRMAKPATLKVVASNTSAIRLYESLGFQRKGQRQATYQKVPVTVLMMSYRLCNDF
ncbi:GNAT family N-acetyltransferase [Kushneria marisflavi]|nr:GNAT family N-acetyltransferase [Kushneria marisflavi]